LGLLESLCSVASKASKSSVAKLCVTLLQREWSVPADQACVKRFVELVLSFSRCEYTDSLALLDSLEREMYDVLVGEGEEGRKYPLLSLKTIPIFYQACLAHLSVLYSAKQAPEGEEIMDSLERLQSEMRVFAALILLTKTASGEQNKKLFRSALRYGKVFLDAVVKRRFRLVSSSLKTAQKECFELIQTLQKATRQLTNILSQNKSQRDAALLSLAPGMRKTLEAILLMWRNVLKEHKCEELFQMGTLKARRADGSELVKDE
jgi:hypothetical protein